MSDLKQLSDEELIQLISPSSDVFKELANRNIIRSKNTVGDLGEYYAIHYYNKKAMNATKREQRTNIVSFK